ncbi:2TM domain-containing protein [Chryseolinea sp. H1M3-3]|uniref:2TM domain-containing protein n=1 Tax=Chryseolinea sp. H1M3-3 TaxID=3034144 RepID=UPI0023EC1DBE|nr:2TM domain-containing protein [Chryseolinea sp. H1M3-3]
MKEEKDPQLWQQAKARADFKIHLTVYLITMGVLWVVWFFTGGIHSHPWPIYPTAGWGIGVIFNYLGVFKFGDAAEREYERLKGQHK